MRALLPRRFRGAAEAGIAAAQYELGVAHVNGDGVAMDRREGVEWLWKAAQQGKQEAKDDLRALVEAGVIEMDLTALETPSTEVSVE